MDVLEKLRQIKRAKLFYYAKHWAAIHLVSSSQLDRYRKSCYALLRDDRYADYVWGRVDYYNQMHEPCILSHDFQVRDMLRDKNIGSAYRLDSSYYLRYFDKTFYISQLMGDECLGEHDQPTLLKARSIKPNNANEVLMKLDKRRHFRFVNDRTLFANKKNSLVWRGQCWQKHREKFLQKCYHLPCCNVGQVNHIKGDYFAPYMSIKEQLDYKFILCIEGNDVASNLKWVMSSNSLCFMTKPKNETWYMEGRLQPGVHYVELREDYSDLEEKVAYYSDHIDEAQAIIERSHDYVRQFTHKTTEDLVSLLVLEKYFQAG